MAKRIWKLMVWTGRQYQEANCGCCRFEANGPADALTKAGLSDPMYDIRYSRVGYGHYTGRIEVRAPETVAAGNGPQIHADFVLLVV